MNSVRDDYLNSVNLNTGTDFPYLILNVENDRSLPRRTPGFHIMHWHDDLQFFYMHRGSLEFSTLDDHVHIAEGEAVFVNSRVVHYANRTGDCRYNSVIFPPYFLGFYAGSPARSIVDDVTTNEQFQYFHFTGETDWQREVLRLLKKLSSLKDDGTDLYAYKVLTVLSCIWAEMVDNIEMPERKKVDPVHVRMRDVLTYIDDHYSEDITLDDLARSADISISECGRCFRQCLGTTPYKYLTSYRLRRAAQLLATTDEPVGLIAGDVGFHQASHFGKCFKEKTGYSPREYRRLKQLSGAAAEDDLRTG
ncbi:MAG: AraC family transcriptional regulator [Anaerovoracaceae bacterium]|nr:AraC family transcriptional regulator [Anaerovoracaceae bacterium]